MIMTADDIFDQAGIPMAAMRIRSFAKTMQMENEGKVYKMRDVNGFAYYKGEKATFIVQVLYRQNASWQGKVIWVEKKKTIPFRSVLELIKLMDSAVGDKQLHLDIINEESEEQEERAGL